MITIVLIIVLILLLFGVGPWWGYHNYGYGPSGLVGILLIVLLVFILMGGHF